MEQVSRILLFNAEWRKNCRIKTIPLKLGENLIRFHYLGQWPRQVQITFGLMKKNKLLGLITYSLPVSEIRKKYGENTWELSRLVLLDEIPKNAESFFIGASIRYIKREYKNIKTLVSFADPKYGHEGIVYKATNWEEVSHPSKRMYIYRL